MKRAFLLFSTFLLACVNAVAANVAEPVFNSADTITLDELNVLNIKQQKILFDSPVASTTLTEKELEELNAYSVKGISDVVPNFFMPDYGSRMTSSIYVRGIGSRIDQPSVGLVVDNVPYLNKDAFDFDLADIRSVEMLRGPQSTLYGRNTMAGLINIETLSPMRWQGWKLAAEFASSVAGKVSAGYYHKFNEQNAISANLLFSAKRGAFKNGFDNSFLDHEKFASARIKYESRLPYDIYLRNSFHVGYLRQGGYPYAVYDTGLISYNDSCFYNRFTLNDGLTLSKRLSDGSMITSVTSLQYINDNMTLDQDFLPEDYFTLTQKKQEWALTEDIVWKTTHRHDDDFCYNALVGLFGFYKHLNMQAPVHFKNKGIVELIEKHSNEATPDYPIVWDSRAFALNSDFTLPAGGVALYHESRFDVERFHLTAGVRLDYETVGMTYRNYCNTGYTIYHVNTDTEQPVYYAHCPVDIDARGNLSRTYFNVLPRIAGVFDLVRNLGNVYASVCRGFKSGGFNTQMFSDVLQQRLMNMMGIGFSYDIDKVVGYKPEKSWNFEIGAHLSFFEERLNLETALFLILCRDQQLTMFPDGTTTGRIMTNAGKTRSLGFELSANWNATDKLTFSCSYGLTNAKFTEFFDGINNYAGRYLPYVPENTFFARGFYSIPIKNGLLRNISFDVNVKGNGKIYWNESNSRVQPFYALLGASAILDFNKVSVQLWGKNITNTRYYTFYFLSMGNEFVQKAQPVEVGVTLRIEI